MAIPKVIHYCWFGRNPKPKLAEKCIKSWKKYCPDYEIIEWNEDNFDFSKSVYCKEAYEAEKWAFVTDYARLTILYEHGGIYFDTDVELLKNIDNLLDNQCFMGIEQSERCVQVATGLGLGAEKHFPLIREMLDDYEGAKFYKEDGSYDITTCTVRNARILKRHGYVEQDCNQLIAGAMIYASEYFSPMHMESGIIRKTKNTYSIHHYGLSWTSEEHQKERRKKMKKLRRNNRLYNLKVLPNNLCLKLLGEERYNSFKQKLKGR